MQNYGLQVKLLIRYGLGQAFCLFNVSVGVLYRLITDLSIFFFYSKYRYEIQKKKREAQKKATGEAWSLLTLIKC